VNHRILHKTILLFGLLASAAVAFGAPDGEALFRQHCSVCHGDDGKGGVGVPLSLPAFIDNVSDEYLKTTIRLGRPGRIMPAFPKLSDAQVNAIVSHMRGWSKVPPVTRNNVPVEGDAAHGRELFDGHCARCHGEQGHGGTGTGVTFSRKRDLPIIAPALNNSGFLAAASDAMIRNTIILGREGTPMVSALVLGLSEDDVDDVVAYIRSLEPQAKRNSEKENHDATIVAESPYTLEETLDNLKQSIANQNFTIIRTDYVEHGLVEEGKENRKQVLVHFCNFKFLFDALALDPRVGIFLPCRVTLVEKDGRVQVMSINPMRLSSLFNNDELKQACEQMTDIYKAIIDDTVL